MTCREPPEAQGNSIQVAMCFDRIPRLTLVTNAYTTEREREREREREKERETERERVCVCVWER